jgi:O-antigen/teichoic acid export membrane protein
LNIAIKKALNTTAVLKKKGAFHIIVGSFLTKFVAFFGSILLVRVLNKEQFGLLSYIENIYNYVFLFAGIGLNYCILRYVVLAEEKSKKYTCYKYSVKTSFVFNLFLIIIVSLGVLVFPHPDEFQYAKVLILVSLLALPFHHLVVSNLYTYRSMFSNNRFAISSFVVTSTLILCRYIGASFIGLSGVIISKILVYFSFAITLSYFTYKKYFLGIKTVVLQKQEKKEMISYSLQYMITNGIWAIFMLNDIFLLGQFSGDPTILADYKVAYVLPGNMAIISTAIGVFIGPYFVKNENDNNWVRKNYYKVFLVTLSSIGFISFLLYLFAGPLVSLMYGNQYSNVVPLMRILILASFANCGLRFTTAHVLASLGYIKYNMIVSFLGVLVQIVMNIKFIPIYGAKAVAWTSFFVYALMAILLYYIITKKILMAVK